MNKAQTIAEQIETEEYALKLPSQSEALRQYLGNDGLLSNEEIDRALYDDNLTKKALREKVVKADVTTDRKLLDRLTNHLWATHQSVREAKHLLPAEGIDPKATYRLTITDGQVQGIEPAKPQQTDVPMPKVVVVSGNLVANFLHNYRLNRDMQLRVEKLTDHQQGVSVRPVNDSQSQPGITEKVSKTTPIPAQQAEPTVNKTYSWAQVASQLAAAGISREQLTDKGQLTRLLGGQQTGPLTLDQKIDGRYVSLTGKLRVIEVNGQLKLRIQPIREQKLVRALTIPKQIQGYNFTADDRANLIKSGELGRVVELTDPRTKQPYRAFIGTDARTQQLIVTREEQIKLPKTINGVPLTQTQRELIGQGKAIRLDGLTGQNGQTFSAYVQVSAAKRGLNVTSVPDTAVKKTTDLKTASDLNRPSHKLKGTSSGQSEKTEKKPNVGPVQATQPIAHEEPLRGPRLR